MSDIVDQLRQGALTRDDYRWKAADEIERLRAALRKIAAYEEGPVVTGRFDEPWSASLARAALEGK